MGATPTPWEVERVLDPGDLSRPWIGRIEESRFAALACGDTREEAFANAHLIVTAVNNHAALKDAITTAAEWFEEYAAEHNRKAQDAPPGFERDSREVKAKTNANRAKFLRLTLSAASASETGKEG